MGFPSPQPTRATVGAVAVILFLLTRLPHAAIDTFVYVGCSQHKYSTATNYSTNLDSLLTSLLNSASYTSFTNLTVGNATAAVHGLFQCRGDLPTSVCATCVSRCISQLGVLCSGAVAAALRLDGCYVKYDNSSFFGVEDKTMVVKKCGPQLGLGDSDELTRVDSVLSYLASGAQLFRVGGAGDVQGMAECTGDLSPLECQDCLREAIGRLRSDCGYASWGDVFLTTCYARYYVAGSHASSTQNTATGSSNDSQTQKTLAMLIGIIAVVALIVIFGSFLKKRCNDDGDK